MDRRAGRAPRSGCEFCTIVAGRAPASIVYQDARALALMDINPVRPGHILVVPKAHRAQIWEMADAEWAAVYRRLPTLVRALKTATSADAVDILSLNGRAGGQSVFHLHVHLIPVHAREPVLRRKGRRVTFGLVQQRASRADLEALAERIRANLPGRSGIPRSRWKSTA
jgi:histidine triad (HIT) family protein